MQRDNGPWKSDFDDRHSVALILSSAAAEAADGGELTRMPPFGSTDIIECSVELPEQEWDLPTPPFGSTDIIECSSRVAKCPGHA